MLKQADKHVISYQDRRLALRVIREIEAIEKQPIHRVPADRVTGYVHALADLVWDRAREELKYDKAEADRILHGLRERTVY